MNENTTRNTRRLPLIAFASLPLTIGLGFAQQSAASTSAAPTAQAQRLQPAQPGQTMPGQTRPGQMRPNSGTNHADVFLQKLAAQLGTTVPKLRAAAIAAGSATIDQGVKAGDIPAGRAAAMKQRLQQHPFAAFGGRGHGGPGLGRDGGPRGPHPHDRSGNDVGDPSGRVTVPQTGAQTEDGT
ncbi:hypothetical protein [Deinococcus koreensis]|uniref:Uncharacterized protein n=1 Tax=Deinococcus koreensis TaxID=2054903 RepID=A0A2K3V0T7_9DEIO|nr:hypothetical protein [Deinococcus koreensis]PNY82398.1 hypothetical protein CVO96_14470 [Deinococcus koreensis]